MPIYEYECEEGHEFELIRPFSDMDKPAWCPIRECGIGEVHCGLPATRRKVPSRPAVVIFRGSGFTRSSTGGAVR